MPDSPAQPDRPVDSQATVSPSQARETPGTTQGKSARDSTLGGSGATPAAGSTLGRFRLLRLLGSGSFGEVYLAYDPKLDRQVAIKVARQDRVSDPQDVQRFFREARAVAQFKHPHIVPVHEVGQEGPRHFIVVELVEGESLAAAMKVRRFTPQAAVALLLELASAVHYAHQKGVFHRDIKPGNVMLDAAGRTYLMDFGLARRLEGEALQTQAGDVLGTPAYMPPEQAAGKAHLVDARSDLYSLGVMLYELLTGQRPFLGTVYEVIRQVQESEPRPPRQINPAIPRDLEAICLKALAKQPDERYPSVQHLVEELQRWLRNEPVQARPIGPLGRTNKWVRRHPLRAGLLGGLCLTALATLVYVQTQPAWVDVRVSPLTAGTSVSLDGRPIELDKQGRALVSSRPGRAILKIAAPGHLSEQRDLVLVRGSSNTVVASINLVPSFGYLQLSSKPPGATVEVVDMNLKTVAQGPTPFHSPRLPSGTYAVTVKLPLYHPIQQTLEVPTGDRPLTLEPLILQPISEHSASYDFLQSVRKRLAGPGSIELVEVPLQDVLTMIADEHEVQILTDSQALESVGLVQDTPITFFAPQAPLEFALIEPLAKLKLAYTIERLIDGSWVIRITSQKVEATRLLTVIYEIGDLVPGATAEADFEPLWDQLTSRVAPKTWEGVGGPGSADIDATNHALIVNQTWGNQLLVDNFLKDLRQQRAKAAPVGTANPPGDAKK